MKYLIPINNSKLSLDTVRESIEQIEDNAKIILIHCVPTRKSRQDNILTSNQSKRESLAETAIKNATEICEDHNIDYTTEILHAESIPKGIKDAEKEYEPDAVIMSHRNMRPPAKSITKNVLQETETPVTVFTEQTL